MKRRDAITTLARLGVIATAPPLLSSINMQSVNRRKIPGSEELLPVVGLGTWQTFDVGKDDEAREDLKLVLKDLVARGCSVVDSSPMYGRSEEVVGDLSNELRLNNKLFMATKVWTTGRQAGISQMENSFKLLQRERMDLMQIHNLVDWEVHLKTLRGWKEEGKIRYVGLTHYTDSAHDKLRTIIESHPIDFIQINYSMDSRHAEKFLLPAANENGVAVLINRPFNEGALFSLVKGKTLPEWAKEFDCTSWGAFFLKFILANPAVTCVIPGTSKPKHLADNLSAAYGKLPDSNHLKKMIAMLS